MTDYKVDCVNDLKNIFLNDDKSTWKICHKIASVTAFDRNTNKDAEREIKIGEKIDL